MKTTFYLLINLLLLGSCAKKGETPTPAPPPITADFVSPSAVETGVSLSFQNNSQNATRYEWDFGDGSAITSDAQPQHTYLAVGTYIISLRAFRDAAVTSTTKRLRVNKYDVFTHAGIPTTSTYTTRGNKRYDTFYNNGNGTSSTIISRLRDSLITVVRLTPDSLRVNNFLAEPTNSDPGFPRLSATNPYVFRVSAWVGDATFLALYLPGDSLQIRQFSHVGHISSRIDVWRGPRRP